MNVYSAVTSAEYHASVRSWKDAVAQGKPLCWYDPCSAAQHSTSHDGAAQCFYTTMTEAIIALKHRSAKALGRSLSCPKEKSPAKKPRTDSKGNDADAVDEGWCGVIAFWMQPGNVGPVRTLVVGTLYTWYFNCEFACVCVCACLSPHNYGLRPA